MIPPIATTISRLSSLSLALSVSPIVDPIRDRLDGTVRHFSNLVAWATITVAVGVVLEGIELAHAAVEWRKRKRREKRGRIQLKELHEVVPIGPARRLSKPHPEEPTWVKIVLRIGLILVVVGVVGEWRCGAELEDAHNAVHQYDLGKILGADQKAGDAANFAKIAHDEADAATGASKTAQRKADAVGNKADELNLQLLTANAKLDAVEAKRAELEKSLWPREFPLTRNIPKGHDNFAPLKPFAGTNVVIDFLPDAEAARAASQIVGLVHAAGWNIIEVKPNPEVIAGFFDGVIVQAPLGVPRKTLEDTKEGENLEGAASAVVSFLTSYNWVARTHPAKLHEFGVNTIKINIGFKPSPYFRDPEIKKTMEEIERRNR